MRGTSLPPSRGYGATDPGPSVSHEEEEGGHVAVARGGEQEEWSHALGRAEGEEEERLLGAWEDEDEEGRPVRRRKKKLSIVHATAGAMLLALFAIAAALLYFQRWVGRAGGQGAGRLAGANLLPAYLPEEAALPVPRCGRCLRDEPILYRRAACLFLTGRCHSCVYVAVAQAGRCGEEPGWEGHPHAHEEDEAVGQQQQQAGRRQDQQQHGREGGGGGQPADPGGEAGVRGAELVSTRGTRGPLRCQGREGGREGEWRDILMSFL